MSKDLKKLKKIFSKNNFRNYLITISIFVFLGFCVILFNALFVNLGQPIKNINYAITLTNHIEKNNLSLPFPPETGFEISSGRFDSASSTYLKHFSKDFEKFKEVLNSKYYYENETYDCKYWAYVWTLYWKANKDRYNWKLDYITTENHVYVMVSNSSGYIILDGNDSINLMGGNNG